MATPEGKVKAKISALLKTHEPALWYYMPVQNGMGKAVLDYIGFDHGRGFAIEAKAPGEEPTDRQNTTIRDMVASGAKVFVIDGDLTELEDWLI